VDGVGGDRAAPRPGPRRAEDGSSRPARAAAPSRNAIARRATTGALDQIVGSVIAPAGPPGVRVDQGASRALAVTATARVSAGHERQQNARPRGRRVGRSRFQPVQGRHERADDRRPPRQDGAYFVELAVEKRTGGRRLARGSGTTPSDPPHGCFPVVV